MSEANGGQIARATVIDVPMSGQRSLATVTAEIRAYQDAARRMAITYCIEVGRRLVEAKSMVAHGEWGTYLREELGYSQSRANDLMRLFDAYAADQMRLDGDNLKSQAFGNLSYTQALALLALPSEEEREAFVEAHDMSAMSTREVREELRRRGNSGAGDPSPTEMGDGERAAQMEKALQVMAGLRKEDAAQIQKMEQQAHEANLARDDAMKAQDAAEKKLAEADRKAQAAAEKVSALQTELDKARKAEDKAKQELKKAKADKTAAPELLEKLRKEAEEAAEARHRADSEELAAAKKKCVQAEFAVDAAKRKAKEAADRLAAMQKELALAAPELAVFRARFERVQAELSALVESVATLPEDKQPGARRGLAALLQKVHEQIGGGENV